MYKSSLLLNELTGEQFIDARYNPSSGMKLSKGIKVICHININLKS